MKRRLPPLNALRSFEAAARLGSMTAAAHELSVTPGAVSRQVKSLEDHVGQCLIEGSKVKPTLSAVGHMLLPALSAAFDSIETAVLKARGTDATTIDVSCFSTFAVKWLIPRLFDFYAKHPGIEVRLRTNGSLDDDDDSRCDVSICVEDIARARPRPSESIATTTDLFVERLGLVLSPTLAARVEFGRDIGLTEHVLLQTKTRLNAWAMWADAQGVQRPSLNGPMYEHYYFTLQAAAAGLGVAVAPRHLVADDLSAHRLLSPRGFRESGYRYIARRWPQRNPESSSQTELFCTWLQEQATLTESNTR